MNAQWGQRLGLAVVALGLVATPVLAETAKPAPAAAHHATHAAKSSKSVSHEAATDQLNAQSLSAAQQGKDFAPASK